MEEENLIKKAKKREKEAFGALYDRYQPAIYRFIFLKTSSRPTAEDLTHQVFLNAWQNIENYQYRGFPFSSWLYRIARNAVIDYFRTSHPHLDLEEKMEKASPDSDNTASKIDKEFDLDIIKTALKKLNEEQQNVLLMRFVENFSIKETAAALGKSEGAVKVIQHRSIKNLRRIINGQTNRKFKEA